MEVSNAGTKIATFEQVPAMQRFFCGHGLNVQKPTILELFIPYLEKKKKISMPTKLFLSFNMKMSISHLLDYF